jgi:hypothetical protein
MTDGKQPIDEPISLARGAAWAIRRNANLPAVVAPA